MAINIAIVDDHKIIRDGIRALLLGQSEFVMTYEALSGENLKQTIGDASPDLVLLDIELPDICGLDLISFFKIKCNSKVLMLTAEMDEEIVCKAVNNGADGFLNKDASGEELMIAMRTIMEGEPYFGQSLSSMIYRSYKRKIKELKEIHAMPVITDREKEIIRCLSDGLGFKEIGEQLFISPRTVENHKNNLLQKLELKNTIELVKYAIRNKIVEL
jgi:DNA-binding NarL/FixJ family response regulator